MSEQSQETTETISTPAEPKKSKMMLIIIIAVVLLAGGGAGYFFLGSKAGADEADSSSDKVKKPKDVLADEEAAVDEEPSDSRTSKSAKRLRSAIPDDEDVKNIIELQPFIVNLADTEQARYLRMSVSLGVGGEGESEKPDQLFITRVRNAMLAIMSDKSSDEILSTDGKTKLRKDLLRAAQAAADEPEIHAIYITDFIVQL
ncbi:MAG: flagellar basal body-associated FliL family protein [Pyrinomonadaceae bacterium]|nr:flagellar basal body-associated FliL family protein [Pyrinomonadaceae bacterium]